MESDNDLMLDFVSPCGEFKLTFDDDGKVAYAYLKKGKDILGDVWLYNRCPTPDEKEWEDRKNLPFANRKGFMTESGHFETPPTIDEVTASWQYSGEQPTASVFLFGELVAKVGVNDKPGYSRFALRDGPLAKVLFVAGPKEGNGDMEEVADR
jgi:hypothetical protein